MSLIIGTKIVSDSIGFHVDFANRKCFSPNILNYSNWTVGPGGVSQDVTRYGVTSYVDVSGTGENSRVLGTDPFGYASSVVWRAQNTDTAPGNADGGWDTSNFTIDNSKLYRFSVWTKRDAMTEGGLQSGSFYLGHTPKDSVSNGTFSVTKTNGVTIDLSSGGPYFHITPNSSSLFSNVQAPYLGGINVWTLVIGHVWPIGTPTSVNLPGTNINGLLSNANHPDSGVWTRSAGKIGNLFSDGYGGDYVWYTAARFSTHRAYLFYAGDLTSVQSFIYPRVDIVDGLEPSIQELLAGSEPIRDLSPKMNVLYPLNTTDFDTNGRGLNFRGVDANIISGAMSATFSAQTVSVWFSTTSTIGANIPGMNVLQFGPTSSANNMVIAVGEYTSAGTNEVVNVFTDLTSVGGTNNMTYFASTTFAFQAGLWYNLVLSWSGTKYLMYINGVEVSTVAGGGGFGGRHAALYKNVTMTHIGSAATTSGSTFYPYGSNFNGKIGSVIVYERSLEAFEILSNYNVAKQKYGLV